MVVVLLKWNTSLIGRLWGAPKARISCEVYLQKRDLAYILHMKNISKPPRYTTTANHFTDLGHRIVSPEWLKKWG